MKTHTPGPWEIDGFYQGAFEVIAPKASVARGRLVICSRGQHELREREFQANARLIAAAPDLLAAVLAYAEHFERHHITNTHGARDFDFTGQIASMARAAIAKATGAAL